MMIALGTWTDDMVERMNAKLQHREIIRSRRLCPGLYLVDTEIGEFEVCQMDEGPDKGIWFVTTPGELAADAACYTYREAKANIAAFLKTARFDRRYGWVTS